MKQGTCWPGRSVDLGAAQSQRETRVRLKHLTPLEVEVGLADVFFRLK